MTTLPASTLEEWGKKEAARCDSGDPDVELCELPGIINTPPKERSAADEAWSRGRCERGPPAVTCCLPAHTKHGVSAATSSHPAMLAHCVLFTCPTIIQSEPRMPR